MIPDRSANERDFRSRGGPYIDAWQILDGGYATYTGAEIPPSLEVFDHDLRIHAKGGYAVSPVDLAKKIVRNYYRRPQ